MDKYTKGIRKTGFILEDTIVQQLKSNRWTIINNRYYEDDLASTVREMDILAYKASKVDGTYVYTTLLISCKKSEENAWALVSREINLDDVNSNWSPLHIWSNDIAINDFLKKENAIKIYYNYVYEKERNPIMEPPEVDVFAFQELNKNSGKPQNDKKIFDSITGLMKAQSYEIGALDTRKEEKCVYQFNLISIVDSDLIRLKIVDDNILPEEIVTEQLVARYIIRKKEQFNRIRFIKADAFSEYITMYNQLHDLNKSFIKKERNLFYKDSIKSIAKVRLLTKEFVDHIWRDILQASSYKLRYDKVISDFEIFWEDKDRHARIIVTTEEKICSELNLDLEIRGKIDNALAKVFKYNGQWIFDINEFPF